MVKKMAPIKGILSTKYTLYWRHFSFLTSTYLFIYAWYTQHSLLKGKGGGHSAYSREGRKEREERKGGKESEGRKRREEKNKERKLR